MASIGKVPPCYYCARHLFVLYTGVHAKHPWRKHAEMEDILHRTEVMELEMTNRPISPDIVPSARGSPHNGRRVDRHGTTAFGVGEL